MVNKSINDLTPTYLTGMFSRLSDNVRENYVKLDLIKKLPYENLQMAKNSSHFFIIVAWLKRGNCD